MKEIYNWLKNNSNAKVIFELNDKEELISNVIETIKDINLFNPEIKPIYLFLIEAQKYTLNVKLIFELNEAKHITITVKFYTNKEPTQLWSIKEIISVNLLDNTINSRSIFQNLLMDLQNKIKKVNK